MEKTNPAAKRRRNASASARRSAGGSNTANTGSGEAEKNKPPSTTSVATTSLLGIAAVQRVFHFLDGPAEVLRAASASHRWYELATADSVWRAKAVREGIVEKAGVFEVPLPAAAASGGGAGGGGSSSAAPRDKLAGVGLAFYAQIYVLQVTRGEAVRLTARPSAFVRSPPLVFVVVFGRDTRCWTRTSKRSMTANGSRGASGRP